MMVVILPGNTIFTWVLIFLCVLFPLKVWSDESESYSSRASDLTTYRAKLRKHIIVGGTKAKVGEAAYVARILIRTKEDTYNCTGTRVSAEWVLTAAHCFWDGNELISSKSMIASFENLEEERYSKIYEVYQHPKYKSHGPTYDLALCHLSSPLLEITPVSLPGPTFQVDAGVPVRLYGYGDILKKGFNESSDTQMAENLQTATLPIIDRSTAVEWIAKKLVYGEEVFDKELIPQRKSPDYFEIVRSSYSDQEYEDLHRQLDFTFPKTGLYYVGSDQNKTACYGDSGGPLVFQGSSGKHEPTQIGVLHSGYFGCGFHHSPNLYINLRVHLNWIHRIVFVRNMKLIIPRSEKKPEFEGVEI